MCVQLESKQELNKKDELKHYPSMHLNAKWHRTDKVFPLGAVEIAMRLLCTFLRLRIASWLAVTPPGLSCDTALPGSSRGSIYNRTITGAWISHCACPPRLVLNQTTCKPLSIFLWSLSLSSSSWVCESARVEANYRSVLTGWVDQNKQLEVQFPHCRCFPNVHNWKQHVFTHY